MGRRQAPKDSRASAQPHAPGPLSVAGVLRRDSAGGPRRDGDHVRLVVVGVARVKVVAQRHSGEDDRSQKADRISIQDGERA